MLYNFSLIWFSSLEISLVVLHKSCRYTSEACVAHVNPTREGIKRKIIPASYLLLLGISLHGFGTGYRSEHCALRKGYWNGRILTYPQSWLCTVSYQRWHPKPNQTWAAGHTGGPNSGPAMPGHDVMESRMAAGLWPSSCSVDILPVQNLNRYGT